MTEYVIGDIHGSYKALLQCFELSGFDKENDKLITLGDIADGPEVPQCVEELLSVKNIVNIRGNHDHWCYMWMTIGYDDHLWLSQGGLATLKAYQKMKSKIDFEKHIKFFGTQWNYYIDENNRAFVHGGYESLEGLGNDEHSTYWWDRELFSKARSGVPQYKLNKSMPKILRPYKEIFIGHTPIESHIPIQACNLWNLDTGAGWNGKLTIMNIETKEYWQSDLVKTLYETKGR